MQKNTFDKIQHPFMIKKKKLNKMYIEGMNISQHKKII